MPMIQRDTYGPPTPKERRFKVTATGDEGVAIGPNGQGSNIHRSVSIGAQLNVSVIDLLNEKTGQVQTYLADRLEEIKSEA